MNRRKFLAALGLAPVAAAVAPVAAKAMGAKKAYAIGRYVTPPDPQHLGLLSGGEGVLPVGALRASKIVAVLDKPKINEAPDADV